jgi:hypothetical protein
MVCVPCLFDVFSVSHHNLHFQIFHRAIVIEKKMPIFVKEDPDSGFWLELGNRIARIIRPSESYRVVRNRFIAFFGIEPTYCSMVWKLIVDSVSTQLKSKPKEEHLLWALMFLRRYDTHWILANNAGCDEKTFIKWSWFYVEAIADLDKKFVRKLCSR